MENNESPPMTVGAVVGIVGANPPLAGFVFDASRADTVKSDAWVCVNHPFQFTGSVTYDTDTRTVRVDAGASLVMTPVPELNVYQRCTIYLVFSLPATGADYLFRTHDQSLADNGVFAIMDYWSNRTLKMILNGNYHTVSDITSADGGAFAADRLHVVAFVRDLRTAAAYVGGDVWFRQNWPTDVTAAPPPTTNRWYLQGATSFAEIQFHDEAHTDDVIRATHGRLASKWGV